MYAKFGAALVPIGVPLTCVKVLPLNVKLFNLGTFSRRHVNVFAEGWLREFFSSSSSTIFSPSSVSIFVYRLETSNVTKMQHPGTLRNFFNHMI